MTNTQPFELHILEGEQAGARAPLQPDSSMVIGADPEGDDIVLRDPEIRGERVRLDINAGVAQVEVLSGSIEIQGKRITEGNRIKLPPCTPLTIGRTTLAYGAAGEQCLVKQQPDDHPGGTAAEQLSAESGQPADVPQQAGKHGGIMRLWPALALAGAVLAGTGAYKVVSDSFAQSRFELTETSVARVLKNFGFAGLSVERAEEGGFVIQGYLDTTEQQERLEQVLEDLSIFSQVRVLTGEQLATTVQDIYRVNGIKAEVDPEGPGVVRVRTEESDLEKLDRVAMLAREDVAGLRDIVVHNDEPEKPPEPVLVKDDPGKRVAAVVPGDPAYVVTVDGARYFVGSMMPSGHKISAILDQQVVLDKDGTMITLKF